MNEEEKIATYWSDHDEPNVNEHVEMESWKKGQPKKSGNDNINKRNGKNQQQKNVRKYTHVHCIATKAWTVYCYRYWLILTTDTKKKKEYKTKHREQSTWNNKLSYFDIVVYSLILFIYFFSRFCFCCFFIFKVSLNRIFCFAMLYIWYCSFAFFYATNSKGQNWKWKVRTLVINQFTFYYWKSFFFSTRFFSSRNKNNRNSTAYIWINV